MEIDAMLFWNIILTMIVAPAFWAFRQMFAEVKNQLKHTNIFIAAAAVADYRPENIANNKIKKSNIRSRYMAVSLGLPISANQGLKFTYLKIDTNVAANYNSDSWLAAWSIRWGGM